MAINKIGYLLVIFMLLQSCSSVKLVDAYFTKDDHSLKSKRILVIARSEDLDVRRAYEDELVSKIVQKGFSATTAYELFPDLKEKRNRSEVEIQEIVDQFKAKGIQSIVVTSLKHTRTFRPEPIKREESMPESTQKGRYGVSFVDYYNVNSANFLSSSLRPVPVDSEGIDDQSFLETTIYSLEAIVFDLTLTDESQLVGIYEIEATDPKSAEQVLQKFTSIVAKQLK